MYSMKKQIEEWFWVYTEDELQELVYFAIPMLKTEFSKKHFKLAALMTMIAFKLKRLIVQ